MNYEALLVLNTQRLFDHTPSPLTIPAAALPISFDDNLFSVQILGFPKEESALRAFLEGDLKWGIPKSSSTDNSSPSKNQCSLILKYLKNCPQTNLQQCPEPLTEQSPLLPLY